MSNDLIVKHNKIIEGKYNMTTTEIKIIAKPLAFANVQIICPKCHVATRIGYKVEDDTKKSSISNLAVFSIVLIE